MCLMMTCPFGVSEAPYILLPESTERAHFTVFVALFLAIGNPFLPPKGPAWAILLIWVVAGSCGYVVDKVCS